MKNSNFEYNKKNAVCSFCDRKKNPHPDFDEPLVVRNLKLNNKNLSICINCHYELIDKSNGNKNISNKILTEKFNLTNLLKKSNILKMI
tara:strand:- start:392 stop:658 length:267 start_codon:yes stop_codon:yes gene_type:complete